METSPRFFNASLRKSLKVLKSYPGGRSNRRFRERKRRETTPHRRTRRAPQRSGRANGGRGEYLTVCPYARITTGAHHREEGLLALVFGYAA